MNTKKIEKNASRIMYFAIVVGILLLASGVIIAQLDLYPMINGKSLIALSLLPFGVATVYLTKILRIKKSPQTMRSILIKEHDERIVAQKNEVRSFVYFLHELFRYSSRAYIRICWMVDRTYYFNAFLHRSSYIVQENKR